MDLKDVTVVCCGLTARRGSVYCDPLVKVFDVRQAGRALQHLPFPPGPTRLRFHPKFSSTLLVIAASGAVMLSDVQGGGGNFKNYQVGNRHRVASQEACFMAPRIRVAGDSVHRAWMHMPAHA